MAALLSGLLAWGGIEFYGDHEASNLVESLKIAKPTDVPGIVVQIGAYRRWANFKLVRLLEDSEPSSPQHLHASLALLPVDPGQIDYLRERLLTAAPDDVSVLRKALQPHRASVTSKLWEVVAAAKPDDPRLLPCASALALLDPRDDDRWKQAGSPVSDALVSANAVFVGPWTELLRPVRTTLTPRLTSIFKDARRSDSERTLATNVLTDYASDDPKTLADLLMAADANAYQKFFPVVEKLRAPTIPLFQAEIQKKANPAESEQVKDQLAERQTRAAVALLKLGRAEEVLPLLVHSADPRLRSFIINWLNPLGADPKLLIAELDRLNSPAPRNSPLVIPKMDAILFHPETSTRRALILALGTYGAEVLSLGEKDRLAGKLLDLYRDDPDAGIHGAAEWTLRKWGRREKLEEADAQLLKDKDKDRGNRRWFVNGQGQAFAVIEGPVEFRMGSPPSEPGHRSDEILHRRLIPRRFAIATKEVTVKQFQDFQNQNPKIGRFEIDKDSPDPTGPMIAMTWYEAAAYCDWLSEKEGLTKCYVPAEGDNYIEGMTVPADVLERTGYRLPTEAEWEYACRSGAMTSRYFGQSTDLLGTYARYLTNSQDRAWPGGGLLPNDLGLFDTMGNGFEWCQSQYASYEPENNDSVIDNININKSINEKEARVLRGGSWINDAANLRSAFRSGFAPAGRYQDYGFRLARTYR